jgi:hypothetical protein
MRDDSFRLTNELAEGMNLEHCQHPIKPGGAAGRQQSLHMSRTLGIDCTETTYDSLRISMRFFE